jgi:alpha-1,2-mannosyltransferase
LIGASLLIYGLVLLQAGLRHQDFDAYLASARDVILGQPLYTAFLQHPFPDPTLRPAFIYPPAFALLVAPLGLLPAPTANLIWLVLNQTMLAASVLVTARWLRPPAWAMAVMIAATVSFYPVWIDAVQGQANVLILLLVTIGLAGILQDKPFAAGFIGVGAALKLTPLLLLIWLVLDRRYKAAAWMVAGALGVTGVGAMLRFQDTLVFFKSVVPALAPGTAFYANQSLSAIVRRFLSANPYTEPRLALWWAPLIVAALAIAAIGWWWLATRGRPALVRAAAFLPLLPLLSSVSWPHHLVILLPVIWLTVIALANRDWPVAPAALLVGVLFVIDVASRWPVGPAFNQPGFRVAQTTDAGVFLIANALFLATLGLFFAGPWLLRFR